MRARKKDKLILPKEKSWIGKRRLKLKEKKRTEEESLKKEKEAETGKEIEKEPERQAEIKKEAEKEPEKPVEIGKEIEKELQTETEIKIEEETRKETEEMRKKRNRRKKKKEVKKKIKTGILVVIAGGLAVFFLLPTVLTVANSFMTSQEITANYGMIFSDGSTKKYVSETVNLKFIPDMVSFKQYSTVLFKSPEYLLKFWNSVIYTVPILIVQIIIAVLAAYSFTRFRGRLKEIVFFAYIILMLMPYQVTLVPNYLVADWLNILNTRWAIWLPGIASPFSVFLLTKFMRRIPNSLIEAAKIDGAGEWKIFTKICVPLCKGAIYSVAILIFIDYWNMVEQPLILLSDSDMHPLSVFLSKINSGEISLAFAVASIYMIPSILVFLYGEEYLVEGISYSGGLKG